MLLDDLPSYYSQGLALWMATKTAESKRETSLFSFANLSTIALIKRLKEYSEIGPGLLSELVYFGALFERISILVSRRSSIRGIIYRRNLIVIGGPNIRFFVINIIGKVSLCDAAFLSQTSREYSIGVYHLL